MRSNMKDGSQVTRRGLLGAFAAGAGAAGTEVFAEASAPRPGSALLPVQVSTVSSAAALAQLTIPFEGSLAWIAGQEAPFEFRARDLSAEVAVDAYQGIHV